MDITELTKQLQFAIPEELYEIEPGKVFFFVPKSGIDVSTVINLLGLVEYYDDYILGKDFRLNFFPTDNETILETFAVRIPQDDAPDNVIIGTMDELPGFAKKYLGRKKKDQADNEIKEAKEEKKEMSLPVVVTLDSKNRPGKKVCAICPYRDNAEGNFDTRMLQARPAPGSKEEKKLIGNKEDKLYALLRECYVLDIPLDINKVKKRFNKAVNSDIDYQLIIKAERDNHRPECISYSTFDIYVADGNKYKLNLTAVEKAVYLTFLLYPTGIRVAETTDEFRETSIKIYSALPFDKKCEKLDGGLRKDSNFVPEVYLSTLRGYLSTIRTKIAKKVSNPKTAIEFAIEGYKDEAFGIRKSTPEIQAQIKDAFRL